MHFYLESRSQLWFYGVVRLRIAGEIVELFLQNVYISLIDRYAHVVVKVVALPNWIACSIFLSESKYCMTAGTRTTSGLPVWEPSFSNIWAGDPFDFLNRAGIT